MVALNIAFLIALAIGPVPASAGPRAIVEHLSSLGSRVAGYPGSARAAEYVEERLQALGLATRLLCGSGADGPGWAVGVGR